MPNCPLNLPSTQIVARSCPLCSTWTVAHHSAWNSPGKDTGVGCLFLLQGTFLTPGIEPRSPSLQANSSSSEPPGKSQFQNFQLYKLNISHQQDFARKKNCISIKIVFIWFFGCFELRKNMRHEGLPLVSHQFLQLPQKKS